MANLFFNAHPEWYDGEIPLTLFRSIFPWSIEKYFETIDQMQKWVSDNLPNDCQIDEVSQIYKNKNIFTVKYEFRFRTKDDALLFKLAWA